MLFGSTTWSVCLHLKSVRVTSLVLLYVPFFSGGGAQVLTWSWSVLERKASKQILPQHHITACVRLVWSARFSFSNARHRLFGVLGVFFKPIMCTSAHLHASTPLTTTRPAPKVRHMIQTCHSFVGEVVLMHSHTPPWSFSLLGQVFTTSPSPLHPSTPPHHHTHMTTQIHV